MDSLHEMKYLSHLTLAFNSNSTFTLNLKHLPLVFLKIMKIKTSILTLPDTLNTLHVEELVWTLPLLEDLNASCIFREFPSTLLKLVLSNKYLPTSPLFLPPSLVELTVFSPLAISHFPFSLNKLVYNCSDIVPPLLSLPPFLTKLVIGTKIESYYPSHEPNLPYIKSTNIYPHPLPPFPSSLTFLSLNFQLSKTTIVYLPPFLKHLEVFTVFPLPSLPLWRQLRSMMSNWHLMV